jgi:hypothetical protein
MHPDVVVVRKERELPQVYRVHGTPVILGTAPAKNLKRIWGV